MEEVLDNVESISQEEVYNVLEFARNMYNHNPQLFAPDLLNQRLKDINMNPMKTTKEKVEKALLDPKNSELELRGASEYFEYTNMQYKRMLSYLGNMLSFDLTYTCTNATPKQMKSADYKRDVKRLHEFLDKFDVQKEFKKVTRMLVRQEGFFSAFRQEGERYILQELPIDYCTITGLWDYGYLFTFDMTYFTAGAGVDINMYPDVFKKYYNDVLIKKNNKSAVVPGVRAKQKNNGTWAYEVEMDPMEGFWCWKFTQEQAGLVPYFSALFPDLANAPFMRNLQTNKFIIEASKILIGTIPMLNNNKTGNVKDMLAIAPETAGQFASLIKQGLPDAIKFGIAPYQDIKQFDYKGNDNNVYDEYNNSTGAVSGINNRLLYGGDKQNVEETKNSITIDEYLMTYLYPYFNNFLIYHANKATKKFKFDFKFEGTEFARSRETRLENALKLADKGIVLPQKIAAAIGMSGRELERQMAMAKADGFVDSLTPIQNSYTMSKSDMKDNGRPQSKDLTDSGAATRATGSNIEKGGDV